MSSPRQPRSSLLVGLVAISILVIAEWIIFIAAFSINFKLNREYFKYVDEGFDVPNGVDYPPLPMQGIDSQNGSILVLYLLPLVYDTTFLGLAFAWAYYSHLNTVFVLCLSVFAFPMWAVCGIFNILIYYSALEQRWNSAFQSLFGFFAAIQIVVGIVWLLVLIAAARRIDKAEKDKRVAEGVERGVRRRLEEYHMQDSPAHAA